MKMQILGKWSLGLLLAALPLASGCSEDSAHSAPVNDPVVQTSTTPDADVPVAEATASEDQKPAVVVSDEKTLPSNISPSGPTESVIKLAQAGVDESVMLAFVSNSISTFNLSSDDIIYLRDIGITDPVVTAMIQRDQTIKEMDNAQLAAATEAAAPETQTDANYEQQVVSQTDQTAYASAPPQNINYNYFYDSLSPYGSWIDIDGYGRCWQPTVVVADTGWQPYCDNGRWICTSSGWYWYSNYSWGWAPFHYGRWFRSPRWGWCWAPGSTWGPAWVSWRYSNNYCGWAPLPPGAHYQTGVGLTFNNRSVGVSFGFGLSASSYVFVPLNRFCDDRPRHYRMSRNQAAEIYQHTTVNNVFLERNRAIFNRGVEPRMITAVTRTPIHEVRIENVTTPHSRSGRPDWLVTGGRTLAVYHPPLQQRAPVASHHFTRPSSGVRESGRHFENRTGNQPWQPATRNHATTPTATETYRAQQQPVLGNAPVRPATPPVSSGAPVRPGFDNNRQPLPRNSVRPTTPSMNQAPIRPQAPVINNRPVRPITPSGNTAVRPGFEHRSQPVIPRNSGQSTPPTMNQAPIHPQAPMIRPQAPMINRQPVQPATPPQRSASRPAWGQRQVFNNSPAPRVQTFATPPTVNMPRRNEAVRVPNQERPAVRQAAPLFSPRQRIEINRSQSFSPPQSSAPHVNSAPPPRAFERPSVPMRNTSPRAEQSFQRNNWAAGGDRGNRR